MRVAIVSDIHSNLVALEAVVRNAQGQRSGVDRFWALGDLVGYGPWPNETLDLLQTLNHVAVAGNHDLAAAGLMSTDLFNGDAATCCEWNGEQLSPASRTYLHDLPQITETDVGFTLVHGSLRDPVWEYLVHVEAAAASFERLATPRLAVGHSHMPLIFEDADHGPTQRVPTPDDGPIKLSKKAILNPGSVGQPRDGDPRASYAIWDSEAEAVSYHRVEYNVRATQAEMERVGLPSRMSARLEYGW
jgi:predicted phosphodiesterase